MSDYIQQNAYPINYTSSAWTILSPIEQSIKEKIEKYGTPLKDWNVTIYRGVLTGCNEAFIIDDLTRSELIAKDPKSAELIRPILRGRDIKRYGYEFADLYLIATFPSKHYNIDDYPAIKNWLINGDWVLTKTKGNPPTPIGTGKLRLEQTGLEYEYEGIKFKSRKKTNNKWFETQDSIAYWNDFSQQKIVWSDIATEPKFANINEEIYINNTCYMMSNAPEYMIGILNSKLLRWYFNTIATGLGNSGHRYFKQFVELLPIVKIDENVFDIKLCHKNAKYIDEIVFSLYNLSEEEIKHINGTDQYIESQLLSN